MAVNREKQIRRKVSSGLSMRSPSSRQPDLWRLSSTGEVLGKHGKEHDCPEVQIKSLVHSLHHSAAEEVKR